MPDVAALADEAPDEVAALMRAVAAVAAQEGIADSGYRTVFNTGPTPSRRVFHAHIHVLGGRVNDVAARLSGTVDWTDHARS